MSRMLAGRVAAGATLLGLALSLGACDDLLSVNNPGAIDEQDVTDPVFIPQMVNATINEYQAEHSFLAFTSAIFTDEALNGHNFVQWEDIDLRIIEDDNSQLSVIYDHVQRARAVGDDMVGRLRTTVANPANSLELATALAYTGYSYIRLGEFFCYAPVEPDGPALQSNEILALAVPKFEEAIRVAQASGSGASAQRIANLARVGAARASLQQGKKAEAIAFANQVPAGFVVYVRHTLSPTTLQNYLEGATTGTNQTIGVDPSFRGLNDTRVRHTRVSRRGHNQKTQLFTPAQSPAFSGWSATVPMEATDAQLLATLGIGKETHMVMASYLEAQYILAEAGAMSDTQLRAFINERRAVGGQQPFTGADLQAELRDQRRRDFFLSGNRLGDLRRYKAQYNVDLFPSGAHPNNAEWGWGSYGSATCLIPHRNEGVGNPNYRP